MELSKSALGRLESAAAERGWTAASSVASSHGGGRRRIVAVVARSGWSVDGGLSAPSLGASRYEERVLACRVSHAGSEWTVAGFHAPNAGAKGGQRPKEQAYEALAAWIREVRGPVVLGLDTNVWTAQLESTSTTVPNPKLLHQTLFLRPGAAHGLEDAFVTAVRSDESLRAPEAWWTYDTGGGRYRMDRLFISDELESTGARVHLDAPGTGAGQAHRPLSAEIICLGS